MSYIVELPSRANEGDTTSLETNSFIIKKSTTPNIIIKIYNLVIASPSGNTVTVVQYCREFKVIYCNNLGCTFKVVLTTLKTVKLLKY